MNTQSLLLDKGISGPSPSQGTSGVMFTAAVIGLHIVGEYKTSKK